jgi:hypothetical protein
LPFILREVLFELFEVCSNHDKKTIRAQSSIEVFVVTFFGKNVLEKKHDSLKSWISVHPTSHEFIRWRWTWTIFFFKVDCEINTHVSGLFPVFDVKVIKNHWVIDVRVVTSSLCFKIADERIDLKFDQRSFGVKVGAATDNPTHGVDLNGNLSKHVFDFLMRFTLYIVKHDIYITGR